jgi:hypothetical protein
VPGTLRVGQICYIGYIRCDPCSIALLGPLLSDEAKQTPYWRSWVAHVAVLEVALRDEFQLSDVLLLDERIQEHHRLFLKVRCTVACSCAPSYTNLHPVLHTVLHTTVTAYSQVREYDGLWKPKHHFATHLPVDLLRFGPLRGYMCMSFEGFNKIVKQATEISNYRSEDQFVMQHWIMKSAKKLRRLRDSASDERE